ncbi:MAG: hypothetical protein U0514_00110 [Candidatus Andersenbacteria bacterium]
MAAPDVAGVLSAGLAYLHGRITFVRSPRATLRRTEQPDRWLNGYLHQPTPSSWLPASNFTVPYGRRLRRALEAGTADALLRRSRPRYLLQLDRRALRTSLAMLERRTRELHRDQHRGQLRTIPPYVLAEYLTGAHELRVALARGTPAAGRELWALYHGPGEGELEFAAAAQDELVAFQRRVLASLPLTPAVRRQLLARWRRLLPARVYAVAAQRLRRLPHTTHGTAALHLVDELSARAPAGAAERLRARLLAAVFRAADGAHVPYLAQRPLHKTLRASQAARVVRANLKRLGLPLRRPDQPASVGWSVDVSPYASASIVVQPEQRRVLLLELPGDPPLLSMQDRYLDLGLHELSHILRAEAGRRGPFAILATGVRGSLDYEEGLASLLERLAVTERRTTGARATPSATTPPTWRCRLARHAAGRAACRATPGRRSTTCARSSARPPTNSTKRSAGWCA